MIQKKLNQIHKSSFLTKILKNFSWVAGGNILSKILISLGYLFLAKILTVESNGEFGILKSTIDNFLIFAVMGIGLTSTKYVAEFRFKDKSRAGSLFGTALVCVFALGLIISFIIITYSKFIAINILKAEHLRSLLIYVSIILMITSVNSVQQGALIGLQSFKKLSFSYISQGVLLVIGLVIGGYYFDVEGALIGYLLATLIVSVIIQIFIRKEFHKQEIRISLKNFRNNLKTIYLFAIPASLSTIISAPTNWFLNTTVVRQDHGYYEMGLYSATILFAMGTRMLISSLGSVLLPIFISSNSSVSSKKEFVNYFSSYYLAIFLSLPFLIFPELIQFILGDKYPIEKIAPVAVLSFTISIIISHRQGIGRDLIIKNKMWLSAFSMFQWALCTIIIHHFFKNYGAMGLAISLCIGYSLNLLIFMPIFIAQKISPKYTFYDKHILLTFVCFFIFILLIFYTNNMFIRIPLALLNSSVLILLLIQFLKKHVT